MSHTLAAGAVFALTYALAMRLSLYLRANRPLHRWHPGAVAAAALVGGAGFYLSQQITAPHLPEILDLPAFLIMALAAAAMPLIVDAALVLQARGLRGAQQKEKAPGETHDPGDPL